MCTAPPGSVYETWPPVLRTKSSNMEVNIYTDGTKDAAVQCKRYTIMMHNVLQQ